MPVKRGRPSLSGVPRELRSNVVLTPAEYALLEETAKMLKTSKNNTLVRGLHLLHQSCMAHPSEIIAREEKPKQSGDVL